MPARERGKYISLHSTHHAGACPRTAIIESLDGGKPIQSRDIDVPLAAAHFLLCRMG